MAYKFTEEQELIKQNAGEFAAAYIEPVATEIDHDQKYPKDIIKLLGENDFFGLFLPEEVGGGGADYLSYVLTLEEMAKISGSVASIVANHVSAAIYSINKWGNSYLKNNLLPAMCSGQKLGALAWAEPDAAPGVGADKLTAVKSGDNFILNGKKTYVANGGAADIYVVTALTTGEDGTQKVSLFVVKSDTNGLKVSRNIEKMGLRACPCAELTFENVEISSGFMLGEKGNGGEMLKEIKGVLNIAEGAIAAGLVDAALKEATTYSKQRIQFKRPIASFPAIQTLIADIATNLNLVKLAVYDTAAMVDSDENFEAQSAMIKMFASKTAPQALIDAIQIEGGVGYCDDMQVSRIYRDVNGLFLSESSADFPEPTIAKEVLL